MDASRLAGAVLLAAACAGCGTPRELRRPVPAPSMAPPASPNPIPHLAAPAPAPPARTARD